MEAASAQLISKDHKDHDEKPRFAFTWDQKDLPHWYSGLREKIEENIDAHQFLDWRQIGLLLKVIYFSISQRIIFTKNLDIETN